MPKPKRSPIEEESIRTGGGNLSRKNQMHHDEQIRRLKKGSKFLKQK